MANFDYNSVSRKIENEICSTHSQHPKFKKTDVGFSITACCDEFRLKMVERAKEIMVEETKITLDRMLNKMFK